MKILTVNDISLTCDKTKKSHLVVNVEKNFLGQKKLYRIRFIFLFNKKHGLLK